MKYAFGIVLAVFLCASCSSLQEGVVSIEQTAQSEDIHAFEERLAFLDAAYILGEDTAEAKSLAADIDAILGVQGLQSASEARLFALKGRVLLILGQKSKAQDCLKKSVAAYKGDVQSFVLSARLGASDADFSASTNEDEHIVELEDAVKAFAAGLYLDAAAKFDAAFLSLNDFYAEAYAPVREKAWNLRDVSETAGDTEMKLLLKDSLTVGELVLLSEVAENLTAPFTADKMLNEKELFKAVSAAGLLLPASGSEEKPLSQNQIVTRLLCARYLWNLFCAEKNIPATRYSADYRAANEPSPVTDVSTDSADFDAVLGSVENELMDLTDGEHFDADAPVSGAQAGSYLKNVR